MDSMEECIEVRVTPKSKRPRVEESIKGALRVFVSEAPERGKANQAVRRAIADHFGVPRSHVTLVRGETTRDKLFRVVFA